MPVADLDVDGVDEHPGYTHLTAVCLTTRSSDQLTFIGDPGNGFLPEYGGTVDVGEVRGGITVVNPFAVEDDMI